jgi:hypothetical protein
MGITRGFIDDGLANSLFLQGGIAAAMIFGSMDHPSFPELILDRSVRRLSISSESRRIADDISRLQAWAQHMAPQNPASASLAWGHSGRT